jgi:Ala-tRNA(Pro) deacylase
MPPFGHFYGMPVYMDARLAEEPYILFNAGTHRDAIHIGVWDYVRLTDPVIVQFSRADEMPLLADAMTRR